MTIKDLLDDDPIIYWEDEEEIEEAKKVTGLDYDRHWVEWPKSEKHYSKKTGRRLYGYWQYSHREAAGLHYGDPAIVHHRNKNKHDNSKNNLEVCSRADHCRIEPNNLKHEGCCIKGCKNPHFSHGYCQKHFMQRYRKGKFGSYDESKNRSKDER